ncbi:hypothetical protein [Streptomyces mirabilis]|uniref:hypothetical protein n=1 Tax=Streptomyces mirabilis TaxID=68239 RepID=UPI00224E1670|nr:hypothetical protein [Streptomyces mirabilis]MCX4429608.1 hypothetical protein [Streptomyces mirabilis]
MMPPTLRLVLLLLALALIVLFGLITAGLAGLLARHAGATYATALLRAGAAFAATATLGLAALTLVATAL